MVHLSIKPDDVPTSIHCILLLLFRTHTYLSVYYARLQKMKPSCPLHGWSFVHKGERCASCKCVTRTKNDSAKFEQTQIGGQFVLFKISLSFYGFLNICYLYMCAPCIIYVYHVYMPWSPVTVTVNSHGDARNQT